MASKYLEIVTFLKNMAIANKAIAHTAAIAGSSRVRNSFITIEDEDALGAAIETAIDFPCMVMVKLSGRLIDKQQDYRKLWTNTLFFLAKIDTTIAEATAKGNVIEQTETVMNQFISKLWNIMEEEGTCGPFREIDLANFFFTPTGRVKDNFYGWRLSFATEANAPDITSYDDSIWDTLNTDTNGGSSVPGTLPGGRFDANYGTIITVPNGYVSYVATFSGSLHNTPIGLYIDKEMIIDWGDGSGIKSYPIDVLCLKTYSTDATATITVYHKNTAQVVFLIDDNSNVNNITLESITGTLPAPAWNICFGDHLPVLPTLPATARQIQLSATNISQEQVDALLDQLIANGVENGILQCPNTITLNGDKVNILRARNWSV